MKQIFDCYRDPEAIGVRYDKSAHCGRLDNSFVNNSREIGGMLSTRVFWPTRENSIEGKK
jgi:hypothetical protein